MSCSWNLLQSTFFLSTDVHSFFNPLSVFYVAVLEDYVSLSCHVLGICSNPHFFLSTDVYAGQPLGLCRPSYPSFWGEGLWWPSELIYFVLVQLCLQYPVIGTYRSLLWVVLHNERILRDIRNLINVSSFSLLFVYSLYIYRCFNL